MKALNFSLSFLYNVCLVKVWILIKKARVLLYDYYCYLGWGGVVNTCGAQKKDGPNLSTSFLA